MDIFWNCPCAAMIITKYNAFHLLLAQSQAYFSTESKTNVKVELINMTRALDKEISTHFLFVFCMTQGILESKISYVSLLLWF